MGLLYIYPTDLNDPFYAGVKKSKKGEKFLFIRNYGLPSIFWFYYLSFLVLIGFMGLAIKRPLIKLLSSGDSLNLLIGIVVLSTLILVPLVSLGLFFFEKAISRNKKTLSLTYRLFFIPFYKKTIQLHHEAPFKIQHMVDSPNMVRLRQDPNLKAYYNKGHFELWAQSHQGKWHLVDRHSLKRELEKLCKLLKTF